MTVITTNYERLFHVISGALNTTERHFKIDLTIERDARKQYYGRPFHDDWD